MEYKIRTAVPADERKIRELFLEMLRTIYCTDDVKGYGDGDLDRFWNGNQDRIYVAEDGQVVAFLSVEVHHDPVDYIYLDDFSVTAAYRNKRIGSALLRAAEAYAEQTGSRAVILHVEKTNTSAMRFYERAGYSIFRDDGNRFLLKKDIEDMDIKTHYDLLVEENNDPFRDPPVLQKYMDSWDGQAFLDLMELDQSKTILEIGVGTGRLAAKTAGRCRHLTGIDISPKTIARAGENLQHFLNISLICADFMDYPFTETFDVIYSSLTMMHFEDKETMIGKAASLLKDDGLFCLSIDKNQSEWIDTGSRRIRVYPDTPERTILFAEQAELKVKKMVETENAYLIAFIK